MLGVLDLDHGVDMHPWRELSMVLCQLYWRVFSKSTKCWLRSTLLDLGRLGRTNEVGGRIWNPCPVEIDRSPLGWLWDSSLVKRTCAMSSRKVLKKFYLEWLLGHDKFSPTWNEARPRLHQAWNLFERGKRGRRGLMLTKYRR
jgi:hypothetical protein